jgi:hypothetical protein
MSESVKNRIFLEEFLAALALEGRAIVFGMTAR